MSLELRVDNRELMRHLTAIERAIPRIVPRALNRGATAARTVLVSTIRADIGLKARDVRRRTFIERATRGRLTARVSASRKRLPLIQFRARGPEPSRGRGRGVRAKVPGGAGRYPNAFIATMASGHRGVYRRVRRARLPITELHGPSIGRVFEKHVDVGRARGEEVFEQQLRHEIARAIGAA